MTQTSVRNEPPAPVPGGWVGSRLTATPELWRVALPPAVAADLLRAGDGLKPGTVAGDPFGARPTVSAETAALAADLCGRLGGEPGFAVLTGFPVDTEPARTEAAYWVLGLLLGRPIYQTPAGDLLGRVENVGRDPAQPGGQQYRLPVGLPFHIDRCTDVIGLLCVRPAARGGLSRLMSGKALHNILAEEYPELLDVLYRPFPFCMPPLREATGQSSPPWCEVPVFSQLDGQFAAHYMRRFVEESQQFPDAPRLTGSQVAALDAADEVTARPELPWEATLQAGDLLLVNNLRVFHSRTQFQDAPTGPGRLLLRLCLAFPLSPALPSGYLPMFGATASGVYRGGSWRTGEVLARFGTPVGPSADTTAETPAETPVETTAGPTTGR